MTIQKTGLIILQAAVLSLIISCSNSEDSNETTGIKEAQDRIAQKAIDSIQGPIDQAKKAGEVANEYNRQIEQAQQKE